MSMVQVHRSGEAMAKVLVQYIDDVPRIWRLVHSEFKTAPSMRTIARLRERHLRPPPPPINHKWELDLRASEMERANKRFLAALRAEKRA